MAVSGGARVTRLARFGLITADARALAIFYEAAFGAKVVDTRREGEALTVTLSIGGEIVELSQHDQPGRPYPDDVSASDIGFQHFAIVVADAAAAYQRLIAVSGWMAISTDGPQRLPAAAGAVTAFKFRDPEGHPLELLAFPGEARSGDDALGIDHSAISVADSGRSVAFYEALGLAVSARQVNSGPAQARLDGLSDPVVEVTALSPPRATPHVELLGYWTATRRGGLRLAANDIAATWLVFESPEASDVALRLEDPDGHHLVIVGEAAHAPLPPFGRTPPSAGREG